MTDGSYPALHGVAIGVQFELLVRSTVEGDDAFGERMGNLESRKPCVEGWV
ncbi:MAG: hypothetical protein M3067_06160 [Chloroflexota bacterium]|nr:hypothetical protein [Chloroflexota bacterium]